MKISRKLIRALLILLVVFTNIGCDQVAKKMVRERVAQDEVIRVLGNHVTLTHVENSGAFLSAGDSLSRPVKNIVLSILPVIALISMLVYALIRQTIPRLVLVGLCFIIGGGIGNLFDRIMYGSVTDFLHLRFGGLQTGIFNMADVSIMVGVGMVLCRALFNKNDKSPGLTNRTSVDA